MLTVEALRSLVGTRGDEREATAYAADAAASGGGRFVWQMGAHADDSATVLVPRVPGFDGTGAWVRVDEGRVLNVTTFGARGDGRTDDTRALQRALDAARPGDTVLVPARTFRVDANANPYRPTFGGLRVRSGTTLVLAPGSTLSALASPHGNSAVVSLLGVRDVLVTGGGRIEGERLLHRAAAGEWGFGLALWSAENVTVREIEIADCWGDGVYVGIGEGGGTPRHVRVERCHLHGHRRQGISVVTAEDVTIAGNTIERIYGTGPGAGIDLEPDSVARPCRRIVVEGNTISDCTIGMALSYSEDVTVQRNRFEGRNAGVILGDHVQRAVFEQNTLVGGRTDEGAAFRGVVRHPGTVRKIRVAQNHLSGGHNFVADVAPVESMEMIDNTFVADLDGLRLVRLLGGITFQRNTLTKTGTPIPADDYLAQFHRCTLGGNVIVNRTGRPTRVIGAHNQNVAQDRYEDATFASNE